MQLKDKVSEHFTYGEVIKTKSGIDNTLPPEYLPRIIATASYILEPVRSYFKKPVIINSWWRCKELNDAIKGAPDSQHTKGQAVDFYVVNTPLAEVAQYIRDNLDFDQLILEPSWIHCSFVSIRWNRKDVLSYIGGKYQKGLIEVI